MYLRDTSFIDLAKKQLMFNKITYPASSMSRAFRYYKKGFSICLGEIRKLIEAIQAMPTTETEIKENQSDTEPSSGDDLAFFVGID